MRLLNVLTDPQLDPERTDTDGTLLATSFDIWRWMFKRNSWWSPCGRVEVQHANSGLILLVGYRDRFSRTPYVLVPFTPGSLDALILAAAQALADDLDELAATTPGATPAAPTN